MTGEVRYRVELRERREDGAWEPTAKMKGVEMDALAAEYPSPAWTADAPRIAALTYGQHTRVQLDERTAIILERA